MQSESMMMAVTPLFQMFLWPDDFRIEARCNHDLHVCVKFQKHHRRMPQCQPKKHASMMHPASVFTKKSTDPKKHTLPETNIAPKNGGFQ